ncbi:MULTISPECIES: hypothetical protein [unclassified Paraburkholderia]|uniref:hypothetical protein n=1 Tax=unclassified Paraburkholderia TaxID=2615204 RepID=UPI001416F772|nr:MULTISPECIES: hypothetical protein [unclassified Paraburkholderia]
MCAYFTAYLAIRGALRQFESSLGSSLDALAQSSLAAAHVSIVAVQARYPERSRMAATMVGLFIDRLRGLAQWIHAGDGRLYRFRRGELARQKWIPC